MGQAKHNPTAILAKEGKIQPKKKQHTMTNSEFLEMLRKHKALEYQNELLDQLEIGGTYNGQ